LSQIHKDVLQLNIQSVITMADTTCGPPNSLQITSPFSRYFSAWLLCVFIAFQNNAVSTTLSVHADRQHMSV